LIVEISSFVFSFCFESKLVIVNNDQHKVFGNMFDLVSSHDQSRDFCDFHTDQENVIGQLNQNLNINEKLELKTQSMDITLEKVSSNNLTGKHLTQPIGTEIRFPELNLNQTITINVISTIFFFVVVLVSQSYCILVNHCTISINCIFNLT